nr:hypothetical protein [Candidatus Sigynarchaeota archaeon]
MSSDDQKPGKEDLHTKISPEASAIIEKCLALTDKSGKKIYKNKANVIEKGLELLDQFHEPEKGELKGIWDRARDELNMVLVGKPTFLSYITKDYTEAIRKNIAADIITWFKRKAIQEMPVDDILDAIQHIWKAANYFTRIEITRSDEGTQGMYLYHDFHSKAYSEYWGMYFKKLLQELKSCSVEVYAETESLMLTIKQCKDAKPRK